MCIRDRPMVGSMGGPNAMSSTLLGARLTWPQGVVSVAYTHLRAHETPEQLVRRRPPRSTLVRWSAASDVYKRQAHGREYGRTECNVKHPAGSAPHMASRGG